MLALKADEALVITNASGNTLWVNEAFTKMCGYDLAELLDHKTVSFLREATKPINQPIQDEASGGGRAQLHRRNRQLPQGRSLLPGPADH